MYKIIGANQVEYGPVTAEQLRQWIAEGRVNAQTSAQAVGETTWKPISSFPEFAASFPGSTGQPPSAPSAPRTPPPLGVTGVPLSPDVGRAQALNEISGPAIGLMILSILTACYAFLGIILNLTGVSGARFNRFHEFNLGNQNEQFQKMMEMSSGVVGVVFSLINLGVAIFIIFAALKMKNLENHAMAMVASILAIVPCITPCPCCCIGIPIGIWALIVLNKPEVKAYFN
ncbi:MAG: hypothetical protein JWQ04_364 [Pedosphaera sp.]|nr:hypothetical protein [Pedosphaera sp.]